MSADSDRSWTDGPFFIVGAVRSGTTLLRLMVGHHPEICRCREMEYLTAPIAGGRPFPSPDEYRRFLATDRGFAGSGLSLTPGLEFMEQARAFLGRLQAEEGKPLIGATVHNHFDELARIWPNARYIRLMRDPRDVALSCVKIGFTGSPWIGAQIWADAVENWSRLKELVPEERRLELRFEDLVADPERELERLCRFLGVQYVPEMQEIDRDTTYSRPGPRVARSWRDSASAYEIALVEARIGPDRILAAGYELSDVPPRPIDALGRLRIRTEDLYTRARFRTRRYGVGLWAAGVLSRRLPFPGLRDRIQRRQNAIDAKHVK
jgi:hypothetical protein